MDGFVLLGIVLVLVVLAIPVGVIALFFRTAALSDRLDRIERHLAKRQRAAVPVPGINTAAEQQVRDDLAEASLADDLRVADVPEAFLDVPDPDGSVLANAPARDSAPAPWSRADLVDDVAQAGDAPPDVNRATVIPRVSKVAGPDRISGLFDWLRGNWIYAVSAASLGLAGIFFVQYGMERGLLPPAVRVIMGILFGSVLIVAGEWLRRRHGDEGDTTTIYLPSVFSGAGLVSIFAALIAARHLYGLITPEVAFAGQLVTAALAVALGWFYGPLLAAVGLIGAALSPFIVGGDTGPAPWLYAYFTLIAAVGLGIDAVRQWRWISVLALVLGYAGGFLMQLGGAGPVGHVVQLVILAGMAVVIPPLSFTPRHAGPCLLQVLLQQSGSDLASFQVSLATAAVWVSSGLLCLVTLLAAPSEVAWIAPLMLTVMAIAALLWARRAEGLADLGAGPAFALLASLVLQPLGETATFAAVHGPQLKEGSIPGQMTGYLTFITALAVAISLSAAWRALRQQDWLRNLFFGLLAVLAASLAVAILELLWSPAPIIGVVPWVAHVIGVAALMTALATRFAAVDQGDMRRTAHAVLAALSLIALALFVVTTATALTLALAVLLVVAAGLDRRFGLREMGLFIQIGAAVLTYRLLIDPGADWAMEGPIGAVILAFAGTIAAMIAARLLVAARARDLTMAVLESAGAGLTAIFANVLITRWLMPDLLTGGEISHWEATLSALPWLILMVVQLYRVGASQRFQRLRYSVAGVAAVIAGGLLAVAVLPRNPLLAYAPDDLDRLVQGPPIVDTLFLAYAVPGLLLLFARLPLARTDARLRFGFLGLGAGLLVLYAGLEIRRLWQGHWLGAPGVEQGELYTYTLALMLLGAGLLFAAIRKGSALLRRLAMGVIGLVIVKVFLIDAAGLTGLIRVFSFLGLGLSLAGLAWLNRWAVRTGEKQD